MTQVWIGLGGNQPPTLQAFHNVKELFLSVLQEPRFSSLYRTAPQLDELQPEFFNAVVSASWDLGPLDLLDLLQEVERNQGRIRDPSRPKGPRILDLDLLLFGSETFEHPRLRIPHPRMLERAFVLIPLIEISQNLVHPVTKLPLAVSLQTLPDQGVYLSSQTW